MKPSNASTSLRHSLFLLVLVPQILAWLIGSLAAWQISQNYHNEQRDNLMRSQLQIISQILQSSEPESTRLQNLEKIIALMDDMEGAAQLHYRISLPDGRLLAGQKEVPDTNASLIPNAMPTVYDGIFNNHQRRFAAMAIPYNTGEEQKIAHIVLSKKSLRYRQNATNLARQMLFPMAGLAVLCCILLYFGVRRGLLPLRRLVQEISGIENGKTQIIQIDKAPSEILAIANALNHTLQKLNKQVNSEKRFISDAAHQLRTPLAGLISQAELAMQESDPDKLRKRIEKIQGAALRSAHLVQQMLLMARSESRAPTTLTESYDLAALARDAAREWIPKSVPLGKDLGYIGTETAVVHGNGLLMREAINNLIDNALAYTGKGDTINVNVKHAHNGMHPVVILEVSDNGPGVEPSQLPEVFKRFWRADNQIAGGCGLGLPLVDRVATQHNGVATAHNATPHGFIVRITIPAAPEILDSEANSYQPDLAPSAKKV